MSSGEEIPWESLPPQLRTSKLAKAICPKGAADAEQDLEKIMFWGRYGFHSLSQTELGAWLWIHYGQQLQAMQDAELLEWLRHMNFLDHSAFEGMEDGTVVQFIRKSSIVLEDFIVRYPSCDDFPHACEAMGIEPSDSVKGRIELARKLVGENRVLREILPGLLSYQLAL